MFDLIKNAFLYRNKYKTSSDAVVVSCFYNPQNNPYRLLAFQKWYHSIKHLNHRIIECLIGNAKSQLPDSPYIEKMHTDSLLWHKETLINKIVEKLPKEYKYVFWIDADVLFTNNNWLVDSVEELKKNCIVQPFEYCIHLEEGQLKPNFNVDSYRSKNPVKLHNSLWRSFCSNYYLGLSNNENYDIHGHVGFAWGARREVLEKCPLYDKALIGGADHIIAHAAAGHIPHQCIRKSFIDDIEEVEAWSKRFYDVVRGKIGYTKGDLYHIWHGDIKNRQYLQRIKDFTKETKGLEKDKNGFYVKNSKYMRDYYRRREVPVFNNGLIYDEVAFIEDMGYSLADMAMYFGMSTYNQEQYLEEEIEMRMDEPSVTQNEELPEETIEEQSSNHVEDLVPNEVSSEETIVNEDNFS